MIETLLVWLFAATAVGAALLMLVLRHPMRVALALTAALLSLAGIYALLGVHVIAVFQVLIYVGAVMVFMVYAIMLLDVRDRSFVRRFSGLLLPGIAAAIVFLWVLARASWPALPEPSGATNGTLFALQRFSVEFLNEYWLHFELVSLLLVAAVVAALAVLDVEKRTRG